MNNEYRAKPAWLAVLRGFSHAQVLALRNALLTRDPRIVFHRVCVPHPHRPHWNKRCERICPELFPLLDDGTVVTVAQASRAYTELEGRLGVRIFDAADLVAELPPEVARRKLVEWCTQIAAELTQADPTPQPEQVHDQVP